ncbi:hypothetical protein ACVWWQ_002693 [Rhodanobacter sp. TND4EL1]
MRYIFVFLTIFSTACSAQNQDPIIGVTTPKDNSSFTASNIGDLSKENGGETLIKNIVDWKFENTSGTIVSAQVKGDKNIQNTCLLYQLEGNELKVIQADPYCRWTESPVVVHKQNSFWISFPLRIKQGEDYPEGNSEMAIPFVPSLKSICSFNIEISSSKIQKCPEGTPPSR